MSILIKGMEMPPKGQGRMFLYDDNTAIWLNLDTGERIAYEVTPVPTPHGRLVDAHASIMLLQKYYDRVSEPLKEHAIGECIMIIKDDVPTIIEAEEN